MMDKKHKAPMGSRIQCDTCSESRFLGFRAVDFRAQDHLKYSFRAKGFRLFRN